MNIEEKKPVVLCFSGLDPTGGAGIQADIESISSHNAHATSIVTALTIQNTHNVINYESVSPDIIRQQAHAVLDDMRVSAIKIGMLGNIRVTEAVHDIIRDYPDIPVIFDPILAAGGGTKLSKDTLIDAINLLIVPYCHVITPNVPEAQWLTNRTNTENAACELLLRGSKYVLVTGTHAQTKEVEHNLYSDSKLLTTFVFSRLDNEYHGSGCTLAASIAALIAHQNDTVRAINIALDYCHKTLQHAQTLGKGQLIPDRRYWTKKE
jgi:hydroxymethylpyrimidine/phosphomethylpyrimidine kinase